MQALVEGKCRGDRWVLISMKATRMGHLMEIVSKICISRLRHADSENF